MSGLDPPRIDRSSASATAMANGSLYLERQPNDVIDRKTERLDESHKKMLTSKNAVLASSTIQRT
jgi:hypothetical protein